MRNTYARISLTQLEQNFNSIRSTTTQSKICAVIKANAYGHGACAVAHTLEKLGVDYFGVALVEEAIELRKSGIQTPILLLGGMSHGDALQAVQYNITITISSCEKLETLVRAIEHLRIVPKVHIKIDTGMGRIGVQWDRAEHFLQSVAVAHQSGLIFCEGIYSHFAESTNEEYTRLQFDRFLQVCNEAKKCGLENLIRHISSSRALFLFPEYHLDMVRPGIALYGVEPETDQAILPNVLQPVLSFETEIVYFKTLVAGSPIGYGRTWQVHEEYERIITLPVGYADGLDRRLSNNGEVLVQGKKYPIVGRVCMDQCMVSLGKNGTGYVGDPVILIGKVVRSTGEEEVISVVDIAKRVGTTPHEILVSISERVPRVYE